MGMDDPLHFPGDKPPLALIAGPTASGKSALAVRLAQRLEKAVIINADSAQVYADLQILSARPAAAEMGGICHHLFGKWDGAKACSAAEWADAAKKQIMQAHRRGAVPILVGGTGLYLRTLLEGIAPIPPIEPGIREAVRALGQAEARFALEREDPESAARLAPTDKARTTRALEVIRSTGQSIRAWRARNEGGIANDVTLDARVLLPDRAALYDRCDKRFVDMIDEGAIEEVERLVSRRLDPALPVMHAIGVPQIVNYLEGRIDHETMLAAGGLATRQYAKRQFTWFRNQSPPQWQFISV